MTNAEKYKEVFGLDVDPIMCPTLHCSECPVLPDDLFCYPSCSMEWWNKEYKGE